MLKLFSLRWRRQRANLIEPFKIINRFVSVNRDEIFSLKMSQNLREHLFTLALSQLSSSIHQQLYAVRVINSWNLFPTHLFMAEYIDSFKSHINRVWQGVLPDSISVFFSACVWSPPFWISHGNFNSKLDKACSYLSQVCSKLASSHSLPSSLLLSLALRI